MFDLCDVWGTNDLTKVFGGGPDDSEELIPPLNTERPGAPVRGPQSVPNGIL